MMDGSTTYDSIATNTTKEKKEGVAPPAAVRFVAARWVLGILVGAAVLIALTTTTITTTTELSGGLGSLVALRRNDDSVRIPWLVGCTNFETGKIKVQGTRGRKTCNGWKKNDQCDSLVKNETFKVSSVCAKSCDECAPAPTEAPIVPFLGSESQCDWCSYMKCATACMNPDDSACMRCKNRKCQLFTNCGPTIQ